VGRSRVGYQERLRSAIMGATAPQARIDARLLVLGVQMLARHVHVVRVRVPFNISRRARGLHWRAAWW